MRFIELIDVGSSNNWDAHGDMLTHAPLAKNVDKPIAGLLRDLKSRGMLDDTLVVWTTEFGRTPMSPTSDQQGPRAPQPLLHVLARRRRRQAGLRLRPQRRLRHRAGRERRPRPRLPRHHPAPDGPEPRAPHLPPRRPRLPPDRRGGECASGCYCVVGLPSVCRSFSRNSFGSSWSAA